MQKQSSNAEKMLNSIIEGILKKKGKEIAIMDFREIENAVCQYFIICHAESGTQTKAISESVEEVVKENLKERVWHREGIENAQWILLDYGDIVVHVFQQQYRDYFKLESLWADAKLTMVEDNK